MGFHSFSNLAPELRQQIWNDALPEHMGQTFFYYKRGCWEPQQLTEIDEGFDPNGTNILHTYHHELLSPVHFYTPLLFVNKEARHVARNWLLKRHINPHQSQHDQSISFACPFDLQRDCLYIGRDTLPDFLNEPVNRGFALDLLNKQFAFEPAQIKNLAMPVTISKNFGIRNLGTVLQEYYTRLEELWIVVGPPPESQLLSSLEHKINRRWEVDFAGDEVVQQVYRTHRMRNEMDQPSASPTLPLQDLQKQINTNIDDALTYRTELQNLVIRPVLAIRR